MVGLDNLRRVSINGVHAQVLARQVTSRMDVAVQRERHIIHMVVYWLVESEVKEGLMSCIGHANCKLQRGGLNDVRV